jgi:ABC-type multidrug transport system fused ATPase/permease subunit
MFARLNVLLGERRRTVVALGFWSLISGLCEAATLAIIAEVAAALVSGREHVHIHIAGLDTSVELWTLIFIALGLAVVRLLMQVPLSILPSRISSDVQATLRRNMFRAYTAASWDVQSRDREGKLQETITSQTMQATAGAVGATSLITTGFNFVAMLAVAFTVNPVTAAAIVLGGSFLFLLVQPIKNVSRRRAKRLSQAQVRFAEGINEAIRMAEETQVFGVADAQRARIEELIERSRKFLFQTMVLGKFVPNIFQGMILALLIAGLAVWHAVESHSNASIGVIVLLLIRSTRAAQAGVSTMQGLAQSLPFITRTQEAEQRYADSAPDPGTVPLDAVETIEFDRVAYGYRPGILALSEVSFTVGRGEVVGVIGPTGAGKSTLIQLLLQLRAPQEGRYLVNGMPVADYVRADWHKRVVYVPQEPRLLHASVAENIRFERDIELPELERAARLAHIHDDIMGWVKGYDTVVGPRADAVSGGQKQRLCLARALAGKPEVLILDEPTSALDPSSEVAIQESLSALKEDVTMFVIAHRMSTLDIADRVMVILDGRLVAFDTIEHLQAHNSYYRTATAIATGTR